MSDHIEEILGRIEGKIDALAMAAALPTGAQKASCNKCWQEVYWHDSLTRQRKDGTLYKYPVNADGGAHWDTCPKDERNQQQPASTGADDDSIPF